MDKIGDRKSFEVGGLKTTRQFIFNYPTFK